ncbi:hypothetical protein BASA50_009777 [Batrachochytrium salamandrivorans]|uniref:Uncharacterized protein n=1 Tax=Batrachochytrium salamandrivorans TaxID=1357716 RepID=A0ABQ8F0B8_9FUNG|nr:hypothetical protein BASA50_009777 [Batrachochytrium salamandrivorans]KAH9264210.1 hypothetical protein BASA83_012350 [Batrachochytrium salamandrivorans]
MKIPTIAVLICLEIVASARVAPRIRGRAIRLHRRSPVAPAHYLLGDPLVALQGMDGVLLDKRDDESSDSTDEDGTTKKGHSKSPEKGKKKSSGEGEDEEEEEDKDKEEEEEEEETKEKGSDKSSDDSTDQSKTTKSDTDKNSHKKSEQEPKKEPRSLLAITTDSARDFSRTFGFL